MNNLKQAILNHQKKNFIEAKKYYEAHLFEHKGDYDAQSNLSILFYEMGNFNDAIKLISKTIEIDPNNIKYLNTRAYFYFLQKNYDQSIYDYVRITKIYPNHVESLNNIGRAYNRKLEFQTAIIFFDQAIKINNKKYYFFYNRGIAYLKLNNFQEAIHNFKISITLNPNHNKSYHNLAIAHEELLNIEEAAKNYEKSIELNPNFYDSYLGLALNYLLKGNYPVGWRLHEYRSKLGLLNNENLIGKKWVGEDLPDNKKLLIYHEQGLGDTIQFCRYLKLLSKKKFKVIFQVQKPLVNLMNSLDCDIEITSQPSNVLKYDFHCALMSLPLIFKTTTQNIPTFDYYLKASKEKIEKWNKILGKKNKLRVGLAWRGNPKNQNNKKRSYEIAKNISLFNDKFEWLSLHNDHSKSEKEILNKFNVKNLEELQSDYDDVAAICHLVDCVITVDTSYAHLAGALGKKTLLLLPYSPDFRWFINKNFSPWYSSIKIFRQSNKFLWKEVILDAINSIKR